MHPDEYCISKIKYAQTLPSFIFGMVFYHTIHVLVCIYKSNKNNIVSNVKAISLCYYVIKINKNTISNNNWCSLCNCILLLLTN